MKKINRPWKSIVKDIDESPQWSKSFGLPCTVTTVGICYDKQNHIKYKKLNPWQNFVTKNFTQPKDHARVKFKFLKHANWTSSKDNFSHEQFAISDREKLVTIINTRLCDLTAPLNAKSLSLSTTRALLPWPSCMVIFVKKGS